MQTESATMLIRRQLSGLYPDYEIRSLTRLLFEDGLGIPMLDIYSGKVKELSEEKERLLDKMLARLRRSEPVQYVLGKTEFDGLTFHTAPGVLIPRPETEELVDWICHGEHPSSVLDIGTGSGCIAIALARRFPEARVEAWDISPDALLIARENARLNHTAIHFAQRDVLNFQPSEDLCRQYDLIVSNPPYITEKEKSTMEKNVLDWEPAAALFVTDNDPLQFYRAIAVLGRSLLKPSGRIYFELNALFAAETRQMMQAEGYTGIVIRKDLFGRERMLSATLPA